jgi:hypothetical protein
MSGQANNRPLWDVEVKVRGGRKCAVVRYLRGSEDAEALAAQMWTALGRE